MLSRTRRHLDGPPLALPATLDLLAERWRATRPRVRLAVHLAGIALVLLAGVAHAAASPYGPPVAVWVTTRDLTFGEPLDPTAVRRTSWPRDLVPAGALRELDDAGPGRLQAPLPRGTVITDRHLGDGGVAAALPEGTAAVALPSGSLPPLPLGARIDVVGVDLDGRGVRLAEDVVVLGVDESTVWIAVARPSAADIVDAKTKRRTGVAMVPP
jgi:pilus assembly protein CpaB